MAIGKWALAAGGLLAVWLVAPLASAWMAGAVRPADTSAICYSCRLAGELQSAAFDERFRNAHPEPADVVEVRTSGCDRWESDEDLSMILAVQQAYRIQRVEGVWSAEMNRVLRARFGNGTMALLARCIQDSALAPACRATVRRTIETHQANTEWQTTKQRLQAEVARITAEHNRRCDQVAQRWMANGKGP
jgi:hypothetical protein